MNPIESRSQASISSSESGSHKSDACGSLETNSFGGTRLLWALEEPGVVAVCTRDWPHYRNSMQFGEVLRQFDGMRDQGLPLSLLVVNNPGHREANIDSDEDRHFHVITEIQEGIPFARNAALRWAKMFGQKWILFIDDDAMPDANWLREMIEDFGEFDTDVLQGSWKFEYPIDYPPAFPRMQDSAWTRGEKLPTAATRNVAFRTDRVWKSGLKFDEGLCVFGGSDTDFFHKLTQGGSKIQATDRGLVLEAIEGVRATRMWHTRRFIRGYQGWALTPGTEIVYDVQKYRRGLKASWRLVWCAVPYVLAPTKYEARFWAAWIDVIPFVAYALVKVGIRIREYA